jgi:hypothetical protein
VAAADVDVHGLPSVEALLDEPFGFGRPGLFAATLLGLPLFLCCDPPSGAFEVGFLDALKEEELVEAGAVLVVHVFDSRR